MADPQPPAPASVPEAKPKPPFWVLSLYFAEGFPYSLVRQLSTVYFKDMGASLQAIGLTSLYGLPWVLKFLWGPVIDAFLTKRRWLLFAEGALALGVLALAVGAQSGNGLGLVAVLFLVVAFLSASHDIAIDGYYLEALDRSAQAKLVGYQAMSYRLALIAGGGGVTFVTGKLNWLAGFGLGAVLLTALTVFHATLLPQIETRRLPFGELLRRGRQPKIWGWGVAGLVSITLLVAGFRSPALKETLAPAGSPLDKLGVPGVITLALLLTLGVLLILLPRLKRKMVGSESLFAKAFLDYLDQPRAGLVLAFIATYRTGESFLLAMVYPLLRDIGVAREQYGVIYGTFGIAASIAGGIVGGHLIGKIGWRKAIWPLVLAQNIPHLLYMALAWTYLPATGIPNIPLVTAFVVMEAFGAGMGTAAFMVFIMRTCKPDHKAAHMAIATSVMNVSSTLAGVLSGFLAAAVGFTAFFAFTFLVTIPSMALIFFLPQTKGAAGGAG